VRVVATVAIVRRGVVENVAVDVAVVVLDVVAGGWMRRVQIRSGGGAAGVIQGKWFRRSFALREYTTFLGLQGQKRK